MKSILTSLIKLSEVQGILVSREGKTIFSNLPEVFGAEIQEVLYQSLDDLVSTFSQGGKDEPEEIVALYERGSIVVKSCNGYQIFLILKTSSPSPLVSVALNALSLKLEKLKQAKVSIEPKEQKFIPLSQFNDLVKTLLTHYGPAAKLMVKRALKQAKATERGLPAENASLFLEALKAQIDDPRLLQSVLHQAKEIIERGKK